MNQSKKRDADAGNDLFAERASVVQESAGDNSLAEDRDTEFFSNPYAEASQARESGGNALSVDHGSTGGPELSAKTAPNLTATVGQLLPDNGGQAAITDVDQAKVLPEPAKTGAEPSGTTVIPRLMSATELAAYLRVSVSKVWRLEKGDNDFPSPVRIGGSTRWDRQKIDCYLDSFPTRKQSGL